MSCSFQDRVRAIGADRFRSFTAERLAGIVLALLQEVAAGQLKPETTSDHSLNAILGYWLTPLWYGSDAFDGSFSQGDKYTSIGPKVAPPELKTRFLDATALLYGKQLVRRIHGEDSDDLVELTQKGKDTRVLASFELEIDRAPQEIIERCSDAVFLLMSGSSADDPVGTAFLTDDCRIITCKHCVASGHFAIRIGDADFAESQFNVSTHPAEDLAVLTLKASFHATALAMMRHIPLAPSSQRAKPGETVIAFGHPYVPGTNTHKVPDVGVVRAHVTLRTGESLLSLSNNLTGGYSGGPVVDLTGNLIAVACQISEEASDTAGTRPGGNVHGFGIPSSAIHEMAATAPTGRADERTCPSCGRVSLSDGEQAIVEQRKSGQQVALVPTTYCYLCGWEELHWDKAWQPWRPETEG